MIGRAFGAALVAVACSAGCAPEPTGPPSCTPPETPSVPSVSNLSLELGDEAEPFVPYVDGGAARLVRGSQGGVMLVARLRVDGGPGSVRLCARLSLATEGLAEEAEQDMGVRVDFDAEGRADLEALQWLLGWDEEVLSERRIGLRARLQGEGWLGVWRADDVRLLRP